MANAERSSITRTLSAPRSNNDFDIAQPRLAGLRRRLQAPVDDRDQLSEQSTTRPDRLLYSVKEIQSKLSVSRSTLYHLLDEGQLPSVRIGRRRFVTAAALTEFVKALA
ncbi:helix-turn-helix domain-containing protein [Mycolicibacterium chubuense]|uniref:helix-turn-helix domain-containing protein n=1 Tax=Mycolicibacterium chubuense TaxID=1800 RepID=UPI0009E51EC9